MVFSLPALPYARTDLSPHISEETLDFHYGKHHQGYVTKLNAAVEGKPEANKSLEELIKTCDGGIFNNAAQIWNHTFYWHSMGANKGGAPHGAISDKINADFGSFDKFKEEFSAACGGHFGSGWAWLVYDTESKKLKVHQTHDAGCPIRENLVPIITCDVWEHAFYIDYRNAKPEYVKAWWNLVNWDWANEKLAECAC